jgi:hypothetical protein
MYKVSAVVGNKGDRSYLKLEGSGHFVMDKKVPETVFTQSLSGNRAELHTSLSNPKVALCRTLLHFRLANIKLTSPGH